MECYTPATMLQHASRTAEAAEVSISIRPSHTTRFWCGKMFHLLHQHLFYPGIMIFWPHRSRPCRWRGPFYTLVYIFIHRMKNQDWHWVTGCTADVVGYIERHAGHFFVFLLVIRVKYSTKCFFQRNLYHFQYIFYYSGGEKGRHLWPRLAHKIAEGKKSPTSWAGK